MNNKFFTHRLLPILSVFLFTVFVFFTNVKASTDEKTVYYNGQYYPLPAECTENYLLFENNGRLILAFGDTSYWGVLVSGSDYYYYNYSNDTSYGTGNNRLNFYNYEYSLDTTDFLTPSAKYYGIWGIMGNASGGLSGLKIHYSSVDIKDSSGNVFFQKTPLGITETLVVETNKVQIAEQLKKMITGFLKYLIALVISVIAFWKGWQFLSTQLKKA